MEVPVNKGGGENAKVTLEQIVNLVSDTISNVQSIATAGANSVTSVEYASLVDRVSANSGTGGGGSVTSNELSAPPGLSARNSAGTSIQGLKSIVNALSARISDVEAHASAASAAATSVDSRVNTVSNIVSQHTVSITAISNQISGWSARSVGASTKGGQSVINALSNTISDVLSHAAAASAAATSIGVCVNAISNLISGWSARSVGVSTKGGQSVINALSNTISDVLSHANAASVAATSVDTRLNATSDLVSKLTSAHNAVSNLVSGIVSGASARSVGTSTHGFQSIVNALSNTISDTLSHAGAASAAATSVLAYVSAASARTTAAASVHGLQSIVNALSARISAINVGAGLTSTQVSDMIGSINNNLYSIRKFSAAGSANTSVKGFQSVLNAISNTFSNAFSAGSVVSARSVGVSTKGIQSAVNAISNTVSSNYGRCRVITATVEASVAGTLTDIAGTTVAISTGNYYEYTAKLNVGISAANAFGIGITFPAQTAGAAGGFIQGAGSMVASAWQSTIGNIQIMAFDANASGSIILSVVKGSTSASPVMINAQFKPTANGNVVLQYRASVSTSNVKINPGSYARVFRLVDTGQ
jgi:hypothetical protein